MKAITLTFWPCSAVLTVLGGVLVMFAMTLSIPLIFALIFQETTIELFLQSIAICAATGMALIALFRGSKKEMIPRDGFMLVVLVWGVLPAFGGLPLMLHIEGLSFTDAYFESVSALTTTGATVIEGLDHLPISINVWRHFMVLLGGMGILVLTVAILPILGVGGSQIYKAETPGPMKEEKLTPRISETARGLWLVYFAISLACWLGYWAAGMSWWDGFMHMCSTMGLGGFSAYDASFAYFDSPAIEIVAIIFMTLAGVNFALYFIAWRNRSARVIWTNLEARSYFYLMLASVLGISVFLYVKGVYDDPLTALRYAAFNVVSIATTTGYASTDYAQWPIFAPIYMLLLCGIATCAGSTGGGIKMIRLILILKQARNELIRIVHPRAVVPVKFGRSIIEPAVLQSILGFLVVYLLAICLGTLVLLFTGLDPVTAFTAVIASINNTGPGLGEVGPAGNYKGLSDLQTWICSSLMLLGRLELMSVLVLFVPHFWRH
ncbi:MAG: TrkH family potassium uptake protein [Betaproteobacteria bacterium]|nr:TrkH family potassium uptake protein [Betaproteobacteria bacterium]